MSEKGMMEMVGRVSRKWGTGQEGSRQIRKEEDKKGETKIGKGEMRGKRSGEEGDET